MNATLLAQIMAIIPQWATEVVIKGRDHEEVFFSMPKGWKPADELKERIKRAPSQPAYPSYKTHYRWRAH